MKIINQRFLPLAALFVVFLLAGCSPEGTGASPPVANSVSGALLVEPDAGASPYLTFINSAKQRVDVNSYLLTDRQITGALVAAANRGVRVRVIVAGNPYGDPGAVAAAQNAFVGTKVLLREAPARFEGAYVFDHAKYLVADGRGAILGSSNLTLSGLGGMNREYDWQTANPGTVNDLTSVFNADWSGGAVGEIPGSGQTLVLSPGSQNLLLSLIQGVRKRLYIESEEMGKVPTVLSAIEAAARAGVAVRVVLPTRLSSADKANAAALSAAGAKVVYLTSPYPHAKLIIADERAFLGSQNFSTASLNHNREVGVILGSVAADQTVTTFLRDFAAGKAPALHGVTPIGENLHGLTMAQVSALLGPPRHRYSTSYHGQPETAWVYPGQRIYFANGRVVYVSNG